MPIEKAFSVKTPFADYDIYKLSATVLDEKTRTESKVEGSISGGGSVGGANSPVTSVHGKISTETTNYQTIFLKDGGGSEHVVEFKNFIVSCRPENILTLWGLYNGDVWFHVVNESTGKAYTNKKVFYQYVFPVFIFLAILIITAAGASLIWETNIVFSAIVGLFPALIVGIVLTILRKRKILKNIRNV